MTQTLTVWLGTSIIYVYGTVNGVTYTFSLKSDIGYIKAGIDDLKKQQEKSDERYVNLVCKVAEVESSAKQAHKRIDEHLAEGRG